MVVSCAADLTWFVAGGAAAGDYVGDSVAHDGERRPEPAELGVLPPGAVADVHASRRSWRTLMRPIWLPTGAAAEQCQ